MNSNLLKSVIAKNGDTQYRLAEAMGLQVSALSQRINGHVDFRRNEIRFIKNRYNLSSEEIDSIFFTELVSA
jgi:transcriptional regulator with XRE-family HTH domain